MEVLGKGQHYFLMTWLGSQVEKKSKAIYEGMTTRECQGVQGISGSDSAC